MTRVLYFVFSDRLGDAGHAFERLIIAKGWLSYREQLTGRKHYIYRGERVTPQTKAPPRRGKLRTVQAAQTPRLPKGRKQSTDGGAA